MNKDKLLITLLFNELLADTGNWFTSIEGEDRTRSI